MALTVTELNSWVSGDRRTIVAQVTFDSSYSAGGEPVTLAMFPRLRRKISFIHSGVATNSNRSASVVVSWNGSTTAPKLIANRTDQTDDYLEEVPDTTDLSTFTGYFLVIGK